MDVSGGLERPVALAPLAADVSRELQPLLSRLARTVVDILGDGCTIRLVADGNKTVREVATCHRDAAAEALWSEVMNPISPIDEGFSGAVFRSGRAVLYVVTNEQEVARLPARFAPFIARFPLRSLIAAPLASDGEIFGVLVAIRHGDAAPYDAKDLRVLEELTSTVASAVHASRAHSEVRAAHTRQNVITRASAVLASSLDFETTLRNVVDLAVPALGDFGFFDLMDETGAVRRIARAHEDPQRQAVLDASTWSRSERQDMTLCALSTGGSGFHPRVDDAWLDAVALGPEHRAAMATLGFQSMITVPLKTTGAAFGALTLFHLRGGRTHTRAELALAEDLATRAAIAVESARQHRALLEERQRLTAVLAQMPSAVAIVDSAGRTVLANERIQEMFTSQKVAAAQGIRGYARYEGFHLDGRRYEGTEWPLARSLLTGEIVRGEEAAVRFPDGRDGFIRMHSAPVRDDDGKIVAGVVIFDDVTSRREAEVQAQRGREQLALITDALPALVGHLDASLRFRFVNGAYERWLGRPGDALMGLTVEDVLGRDAAAAMREKLQHAKPGASVSFETHGQNGDGEPRALQGTIVPQLGRDGAPVGFVTLIEDVTAKTRADDGVRFLAEASKVLSSASRVDAMLEALASAAVPRLADWCTVELAQPDGRIETVALAHIDPAKAALGRELRARYPRHVSTDASAGRVLREGKAQLVPSIDDDHLQRSARDDAQLDVWRTLGLRSAMLVPVRSAGEVIGLIAFASAEGRRRYDAADLALAEEIAGRAGLAIANLRLLAVAEAERSRAEAASRAKDEFFAMLGHELRNPLMPIVTALELMKLRDDKHFERERAIIARQAGHMLRLVDDLLDVSRITNGKVQLKRKRVAIVEVVKRALEIASPLIEQKRHEVALDIVPTSDLVVDGDIDRLVQALANVLMNAAKYTATGGHVGVWARRIGGGIELRVTDDGMGIGADLLPRLFDVFVQGRRGIDRSDGGLGLGLAIVKSLVELHGGTVRAESPGEGRGTVVIITLPAAAEGDAASGPHPIAPPPSAAHARKVLVVDDNEDAAELLAELLGERGHEVVVAHDGAGALAALESFRPDRAILDIGLPLMDGYELARKLLDRLGGSVRVAALTGYGEENDKQRAKDAGFAVHFTKPVAVDELLGWIDRG